MIDPTNRELATLDPRFQELMILMINWQRQWLPMIITEGSRSSKRQQELVAQGLSRVTIGGHQRGLACDIDVFTVPPDQVPQWVWDWSGAVGEALGLIWGGRFPRLRDFRHFELRPKVGQLV